MKPLHYYSLSRLRGTSSINDSILLGDNFLYIDLSDRLTIGVCPCGSNRLHIFLERYYPHLSKRGLLFETISSVIVASPSLFADYLIIRGFKMVPDVTRLDVTKSINNFIKIINDNI